MTFIHFVWALLPITLLWIGLHQFRQTLRKGQKKKVEDYKFTLLQALISAVILVPAIWIDQNLYDGFVAIFTSEPKWASITRILVYPAVMLVLSILHSTFLKPKDDIKINRRFY